MLSAFKRLVPRISRGYCAGIKFDPQHTEEKELDSVKRVEDELFGRYYGATDSSDIGKRNRSYENKFRRRPAQKSNSLSQIKEMKPNPWRMQRLPLHDPILSKLIMDARIPRRMKKQQKMVVEGKRLIKDALITGLKFNTILVTDPEHLQEFEEHRENILASSCNIFKVSQKDLATWSSLTTPPGIMAIVDRPQELAPPKDCLPITVICDNIREPNNLGSIFRVAAALPCAQVIVMKGCADPWESKCLRGGSGGQFHIPIEYPVQWEELMGAVNNKDTKVFLAENNTEANVGLLPVKSLDDQLITKDEKQNIFIVIGGETHGISREAKEFAKRFGDGGSLVNIPMAETVESMNAACALAVILYEFRRQVLR